NQEPFQLAPDPLLECRKKSLLCDFSAFLLVPIIQPHDERGHIRKVQKRSHSKGEHQLARANISKWIHDATISFASCSTRNPLSLVSSSRFTVPSTSRKLLRQVKYCNPAVVGCWRRATTPCPSSL